MSPFGSKQHRRGENNENRVERRASHTYTPTEIKSREKKDKITLYREGRKMSAENEKEEKA